MRININALYVLLLGAYAENESLCNALYRQPWRDKVTLFAAPPESHYDREAYCWAVADALVRIGYAKDFLLAMARDPLLPEDSRRAAAELLGIDPSAVDGTDSQVKRVSDEYARGATARLEQVPERISARVAADFASVVRELFGRLGMEAVFNSEDYKKLRSTIVDDVRRAIETEQSLALTLAHNTYQPFHERWLRLALATGKTGEE